ncbi:MAG: TonB-dependent receptor [Flavobacteriaceae bacterium]|nr:TonB-dependent receptor [Flavobacteriaceae bacterium]
MANFSHSYCFFYLIFFIGIISTHAQDKTISGVVTDTDGLPIPGVEVIHVQTNEGTLTDFNGLFTITDNFTDESTLKFSYVGLSNKEVKIDNQDEVNVTMEESFEALEDVIVLGYGSQLRKNVTGSVSTIDGESFESRPNNRVESLMQGQAAGVQVLSGSGKPSAGINIRIRGTNSINAGSEPLYVVDGVPTTDTRSINPTDIESITTLKDASSAAIYGAQGANGVVLITTKSGTTAKPKVTFDAYTGVSQVWRTLGVLNGEQYRDLMTEMGLNTNWDNFNERTDWQNKVFENGLSQNYQASVSGKTETNNYYVSAGYTSQDGAVRSASLERSNFKINFDQNINDHIKVGTRIAYTQYTDVDVNDNNNVNAGGVLLGALTTPSIIGTFNPNGSFTSNPFQNWENPLASTDGLEREFNSTRFLGNVYLEAKLAKNLNYRINYGIDENRGVFDSFLDPFRTAFGNSIGGQSIYNTNKTSYYIFENTITYDTNINNHLIEALVGTVGQKFRFENSSIETRNFSSGSVSTPNAGSVLFNATADKSERSNASFISRVNYSYKDTYLFTANFRADGSSAFGPDNRWGYFPSFSSGWRISNEDFFEDVSFVNDLKLRAGWGIVGNDQIDNFAYLGRVGAGANYPFGGVGQPGTFPASIENLTLRWEESEQTNVGIDFELFEGRVGVVIDAYRKDTRNLLLNAPIPTSTGFDSAIRNVGDLRNQGIEFSFNTVNVSRENFIWNSGFNISFNRNEVINIVGQEILQAEIAGGRGEASIVREGAPLGSIYGYVFGGVDPASGNAFYIDSDGESTFSPSADDRRIIGDANPNFFFGFTNNFTYKNFDLFVFIQGSQGNDLLNATRIETEGMIDPKNQSIAVLNRWRNPGDVTNIPRASFGNIENSRVSTRFVEDASYIRFKTITLSYNIPEKLLTFLNLNHLRVYVTGENIFTITNYTGFDPEVNAFGGSNTVQGIDFGTYPQTRNLLFGVSASF